MATFHASLRLPLELRIQIWESAIEGRVLEVRKLYPSTGYWSPTMIPAITRACQESRKYCSYKKAFIRDWSSRYIWVNFESDIIQVKSGLIQELVEGISIEMGKIRHLRIELVHEQGWDLSEDLFYKHSRQIRYFPLLRGCDVPVEDGLAHTWTAFIYDTYWGACPRGNVRMIDAQTGEWIDGNICGPYQDYIDTNGGETRNYVRDTFDPEWGEKDDDERYEAMRRIQIPLPRINLNY